VFLHPLFLELAELEKEVFVGKLRRLNDRKDNLEECLEKGGRAALLDAELGAELIATQITAIDAFIATVNTHKASL